MTNRILGLDIGGANLKAAHSTRAMGTRSFALWKNPAGLTEALRDLAGHLPDFDRLAVTMTGELCDCFATKREGVAAILDSVDALAAGRPVQVWQTTGCWADSATARAQPLETAAANWHALATWAGRYSPREAALVIDIGSTTTDIIPIGNGRPVNRGRTDTERLATRELVYTGVRRTPLCALIGSAGAAEWFATTHDVYLFLGLLPENATDCETADGRPAIRTAAHARLARMLCADAEILPEADALCLAKQLRDRQLAILCNALEAVGSRLPQPPATVIQSGSGEFLIEMALQKCDLLKSARRVSLASELSADVSQAACAYALMVLASESDNRY